MFRCPRNHSTMPYICYDPIAEGQWIKIPYGSSRHLYKRGKVIRTSPRFLWVQELPADTVFKVHRANCMREEEHNPDPIVNDKVHKHPITLAETLCSRRCSWRSILKSLRTTRYGVQSEKKANQPFGSHTRSFPRLLLLFPYRLSFSRLMA